jgi:tRNA pseudouridine38-40 synthase
MRTLKLVIEYDGTAFVGWQTQPNGRSVQEEIEKVLAAVLQEPVSLIGAGRTDSGVHARGQAASFTAETGMSAAAIRAALNGLLPEDVYIVSSEDAPAGFHARYSARERFYRYFISFAPSAINRRYEWYVKYDLNVPAMNRIAESLIGEHDFESFCKYAADVDHYRCTIKESRWIEKPGALTYEIRGNRFLHGMVRALVGTMVDIGRGYTPEEHFPAIMRARDRRRAGMAAPPHGLFLEEVVY